MTKPEGNYVAISDQGLDIGTTKEGIVNVNPLSGNLLFNMIKREYEKDEDGKPIKDKFTWVSDDRDALSITVKEGDGLEVYSREDQGKTPLLKHHDGGGKIEVRSGRIVLQMEKGELVDLSRENLVVEELPAGGDVKSLPEKNSAAFEFLSDSPEMAETIRTSSSNRFQMLDGKGEVRYKDDYGLKVSNSIEDNALKTKDDLTVRYPKIKFSIDSDTEDYQDITPNMAQFYDEWMKHNPLASVLVEEILFDTQAQASSMGGKYRAMGFDYNALGVLHFGERFFDRLKESEGLIARNIDTALKIGDHELRHNIDNHIIQEESLNYPYEIRSREGIMAVYDRIAHEMGKMRDGDKLLSQLRTEFNQELALANSPGISAEQREAHSEKVDTLNALYTKRFMEVMGVHEYAWRDYTVKERFGLVGLVGDEKGIFAEIPTVYGELSEEEVKYQIQRGNKAIIMMTQANHDIGVMSPEQYYARMGSYCDNNPCGKCLEYTLNCDTGRVYYVTG